MKNKQIKKRKKKPKTSCEYCRYPDSGIDGLERLADNKHSYQKNILTEDKLEELRDLLWLLK